MTHKSAILSKTVGNIDILTDRQHLAGILILFVLVSSFVGTVLAADISVNVDRNPVSIDESFQIIFTADEEPDYAPDFTPLADDFEILNQSQSSNYSMVNGVASRRISWTLNAMAKNTGQLTIPAIAFGKDSSAPLSIVVNDGAVQSGNSGPAEEIFLKVMAQPESPYVQEQTIYTVRLYRRVNIAQASLTEPDIENSVVVKLGEDATFNTVVDGQRYVVTERKYAIFPQQSGPLKLSPLTLTAQVVTRNDNRSRFDSFFNTQTTRTKKVLSDALQLDVLPVPLSAEASYWLPAQKVELKESWSDKSLEVQVGEPVTRTVALLVHGATVGQLPELFSSGPIVGEDGQGRLKSYPDQPDLQEQNKAEGVVALREEKVALIPSEPGFYTLPAIDIPWWNTETSQMETARLPATRIHAVAAEAIEDQSEQQQPGPELDAKETQETDKVPSMATYTEQVRFWQWLAIALATGWLLTVLFFLLRRSGEKQGPPGPPADDVSELLKSVRKAAEENNATATKDALLQWGRRAFGQTSLARIAEQCEESLQEEILALNTVLYGRHAGTWRGKDLADAVKRYRPIVAEEKSRKEEMLQPLYKI